MPTHWRWRGRGVEDQQGKGSVGRLESGFRDIRSFEIGLEAEDAVGFFATLPVFLGSRVIDPTTFWTLHLGLYPSLFSLIPNTCPVVTAEARENTHSHESCAFGPTVHMIVESWKECVTDELLSLLPRSSTMITGVPKMSFPLNRSARRKRLRV